MAFCSRHTTPSFGQTNLIVAADGSGQFKTVQEAINAVPQTTRFDNPAIIHIKPGIYKELIYAQHEKRFVHLVGEDPEKTVLTYNLNANMIGVDGKPIGTFRTPSTFIDADDFTIENLTFENSAGPVGQASGHSRRWRSDHVSQLPLPGLAGHDPFESGAAVF